MATALRFDPGQAGMQMQELHRWLPGIGLDYSLGVDGLSLPLVIINGALTLVSAVITRDISQRPRIYFAMLLLISGAVNGAFLATNLLLFFLFYELELIPLWLLISVWGGKNKAYAATKFLIFTALSGMLILGGFLGLALLTGTVDFSLTPVLSDRLSMGGQILILSALLIGFGIKIPLVPLAQLAARCPHPGLHARVRAAGRCAAQAGHLRPAPLRAATLPGWPGRSWRRAWRSGQRSRCSTAPWRPLPRPT